MRAHVHRVGCFLPGHKQNYPVSPRRERVDPDPVAQTDRHAVDGYLGALRQSEQQNTRGGRNGRIGARYGKAWRWWRGRRDGNGCHGGDPRDAANAMNPARGFLGKPKEREIPGFCGRCHVGVLENYRASAHGKALGQGGPTCVTCHGNHRVVRASLELINEKSCSRCHSYERARQIREAMQEIEARIVATDGEIVQLKQKGFDTKLLEQRLFAARNDFHAMFHEVDLQRIKNQTGKIGDELQKLASALQEVARTEQKKKLMGAGAIALALLAALLLTLYRRTFE